MSSYEPMHLCYVCCVANTCDRERVHLDLLQLEPLDLAFLVFIFVDCSSVFWWILVLRFSSIAISVFKVHHVVGAENAKRKILTELDEQSDSPMVRRRGGQRCVTDLGIAFLLHSKVYVP